MKTYFRLLSFARPFGKFIPTYILVTILQVVFSLVNFAVLIPLLEILFDQIEPEKLENLKRLPEFTISVDYFKSLFYYHFSGFIDTAGKTGALKFVCAVIVISVFLANLFRYLSAVMLAKIRALVIKNLRTLVYERILSFPVSFFTERRKGDIVSRVTNDVQEVEHSVVSTLKVLFKEPAMIIGYFAVLFSMSVELTLYTMLLLPISGGLIAGIARRLKKRAHQSQQALGNINNILDESIGGIRIIKAFTATRFVFQKFIKEVQYYARKNVSIARRYEMAGPISEFLGVSVVAGILLVGGNLILQDNSTLTPSEFLAFLIIFSQILPPAKAMSSSFSNIQRGLAAGERIFEVIDTQSAITDARSSTVLPSFSTSIEFKNVSFAYEKELVLKNINLSIPKGKTVALVGPSGGGKSTLSDLIPRFYDPNEGDVCIDGKPLTSYTMDSIRKQMGIVTQESILFNDTVLNNIAFGVADADEKKVIAAAKIANAHEFIAEMPEGYYTEIGDRGVKLSGGQRQRLSIARAIFKNPPILILDEATSALDSESEKLVQEALTNLMKNRTSVVIAHRLSTIQNADLIVVLQNGQIAEQGTHNELIARAGLYSRLIEMQSF
ncbi:MULTISPECIES: ABC transporter ATP-binding protein [unclassified Imperialibacter]|uniref:ABC transporter ATP-binding protein n=1 Tax=unclassified Imperialibacter TaxID=2629706 RepID=UPI0012576F00|nr:MULTISPECIES: ABC transporter ATP-binding protein [unclassified Imperialibacter]CAD5272024.1 Lipid A export ATP-binding/permease protein MsbA [Imperialibacter sp. 89]CAD5299180.1 Lipid A export ATP-binding/permease protein MsbA [Imperialibacter sp. 75]VVT35155.1 Lipid A export ATP-binding/permease protein MsbA [Imperialibacter sp. EC-SDR9]